MPNVFDVYEKELKWTGEMSEGQILKLAKNLIEKFATENIKQVTCKARKPNKKGEYVIKVFNVDPRNGGSRDVAVALLIGNYRICDAEEAAEYLRGVEAERLAHTSRVAQATNAAAQASLQAIISSVKPITADTDIDALKIQQENDILKARLAALEGAKTPITPEKKAGKKEKSPEEVVKG